MQEKDLSAQYFLSSLSHELRTPLNGIVGYTQLMLSTKLDNNQQSYLNSMNHCCIQLVEIINDILDFSKLATGKSHVSEECFSFKEIIEEIESAIGYKIKEKKQKLRYILNDNLPEFLICDKQKIIQILVNLISNANKFTQAEGRIIVSINLKDKNIIEFSVEDNGIGISDEDQKKLFEPFVQLNQNIKTGHGLGLAISRKLVELLNGTISVSSGKGEGSVFTFTVQYRSYEDIEKLLTKNRKIFNNKYILVVDDNVDSRLQLGEIFFEYNMVPVICSSGKEALHMIIGKRYVFSAVLIDISLTDMAGTELAKKIKEKQSDLYLIALSSISEGFDKSNFEQVLYKPINKLKLLDTICKILSKDDVSSCQINVLEETEHKSEIKFLVSEDDTCSSEMLVKMLNSMGYKNIEITMDGEEAINKLSKNTFDIILLDLKMPKKDGFDVLQYIKAEKSNIKTVIITASVLDYDKEKCKEYGANFFLIKPFQMSNLKSVINKILYGSKKL